MDDTQQTQQPTTSAPADTMSSMGDVAGMTPPPAPVMPDTTVSAPAPQPMPVAPSAPAEGETAGEDYSYAEDVLNEILDSLDRMEAKLEAIEKKLG